MNKGERLVSNWWESTNWVSVHNTDGSRTIGYSMGGVWVLNKEGVFELRFPVCETCPNYPYSAVVPIKTD